MKLFADFLNYSKLIKIKPINSNGAIFESCKKVKFTPTLQWQYVSFRYFFMQGLEIRITKVAVIAMMYCLLNLEAYFSFSYSRLYCIL